MKKNAF